MGLTLGKDPDPLRPDRRAARELSSFRPASAKTMRCELTRTHLVAVTIKPGIIALTDALVRMTLTTICRPDLPILKGDVATCEPSWLGHEGVSVVEEVGAAVIMLKPADRVLISRITACGKCVFCRKLGVVTLHKRPRLDRSWSIRPNWPRLEILQK